MRALLNQCTVVQHPNHIGLLHGRQTVGNDQGGAALHGFFQSGLHHAFAVRVQRAGGFVQQQQRRVFQHGARDRDALALPLQVALLKGRANYVCHYHLERNLREGMLPSRQEVSHLHQIARFAKTTNTGDKAELSAVPEDASAWMHATSTRDNCLGQSCPNFNDCFLMKARRAALEQAVREAARGRPEVGADGPPRVHRPRIQRGLELQAATRHVPERLGAQTPV